ncbi:hypothetical protein KY331_01510 [Candidatus Woesearchaeota archaeon]|nr:hypothetical protein [Candidatus Woesearchaeota archaeon]
MEEKKLKKLINKRCYEDRDPHLWEITSSAPVQIEGIRIFQSSYFPEADPMPYSQWVLVDDSKLYDGDELIELLKKKKIFPKSEEEALKLSRLIVFARGDPLFDAKRGGKDPAVNKKEDHYEIVLTVLKKPMRVIKVELTIKLGEDVYEVNEEEENVFE